MGDAQQGAGGALFPATARPSGLSAILGAAVAIPVHAVGPEQVNALKKKLTIVKRQSKTFAFSKDAGVDMAFFFRLEGDYIIVPRLFGMRYAASVNLPIEDRRAQGTPIGISFNEAKQSQMPDLKLKQDRIIADVMQGLRVTESNSGLLLAGTGTGKTVMGTKVACLLGVRTLICVDSEFMLGQWKKELLAFSDLKEEDIGYIWQDQHAFDKKVVIGMIQTIIRRDFTPEERKAFGLVLFDEVQVVPADRFSQALLKFDAKYVLGLTATPDRFDGADVLLTYGFGAPLNRDRAAPVLTPEVFFVKHKTLLADRSYKMKMTTGNGDAEAVAMLGKLVQALVKLPSRNALILRHLLNATNKGRNIMVYSARREHLRVLKEELDKMVGPGKTAYFMGGIGKKAKEEAVEAQVMFCTYQFAAKALNVPDRDCLFMATPISAAKQTMGRVLRPKEGKKQPIVVDIFDEGVAELESMANNRMRQYKSIRAKIHLPNGDVVN